MVHRLQLLDAAGAVAFDFTDRLGATNPHGLKSWPLSDLALGFSSGDPIFHESRERPGGTLIHRGDRLIESRFHLNVEAANTDALHYGVSELDRLLKGGGTLEWQPDSGTTRFIDIETGWTEGLLRGQDATMLYQRLGDWEGLPIVIVRQPTFRLAEVTSSAVAVPNDPAASSGMIFEGTIEGNAPAPVSIKIESAGGNIRRAVVALFQGDGQSDYVASRKFFQAESGTLSGDTASVADADASGGNAAECSYTSNPTVNAKRVRIPISTLLDPLKRELAIFVRMKATAAAVHEVQLRWASSLADPAPYTEDPITLTSTNASSHGYVFKRLGTIRIPDNVAVAGVVIELWSRRVSGTGNLRFDFVAFAPADAHLTELSVPGGSEDFWFGDELVTPPTNPAGLTAGVIESDNNRLVLADASDAGGTPPNTGNNYASGHHEVVFAFEPTQSNTAWTIRVRNITDSSTTIEQSGTGGGVQTQRLQFTSVVGKAYQFQIIKTSAGGTGSLYANSISHTFVPSLLSGESFLTNPDKNRAYKVDSTDSVIQDLSIEGGIPAWIEAGPFALLVHVLDVEKPGYTEGESVLSRSPLVSITHSPRVSM